MKKYILAAFILAGSAGISRADNFKPIIKSTDTTYHVVYTQAMMDEEIAKAAQLLVNYNAENANMDKVISDAQARKAEIAMAQTQLQQYFNSLNALKAQQVPVNP